MKIINLLPKPKQLELHYEGLFHSVSVAAMLAVAILLVGLVIQLGVRVYLSNETRMAKANIEKIKLLIDKEENLKVKEKIRSLNVQMNDYKSLAESTPAWSQVLVAFASQVPQGVKINSLTADWTTKKIDIQGQSPTREQVIALYNNISQDSKNFRDIDYPLENVAQPTDVTFHFTFFVKDDLLKVKQ